VAARPCQPAPINDILVSVFTKSYSWEKETAGPGRGLREAQDGRVTRVDGKDDALGTSHVPEDRAAGLAGK
jgi:hypothetical protein